MSMISGFSNITRYSGMVSGLDIDEIVSGLMTAERAPYDRLYQKKQIAEWKQEDYRDIISTIRTFQSTYLDETSSSNMLSSLSYKEFSSSCIDSFTGETSAYVTASGTSETFPGEHTVKVFQTATTDVAMSKADFSGTGAANFAALNGKDFLVTIDGEQQTITFTDNPTDNDDLVSTMQSLIDSAFGEDKAVVSHSGGTLTITTGDLARSVKFETGAVDALADLNITDGSTANAGVTEDLLSSAEITAGDLTDMNGKDIKVRLDGVTKTITLGNYASVDALVTGLQTLVDTAFGSDKITVSKATVGGGDGIQLSQATGQANKISVYSGDTDNGLSYLHFSSGDSNRINLSSSLAYLASGDIGSGSFASDLDFEWEATDVVESSTAMDDVTSTTWDGRKFYLTIDEEMKEITLSCAGSEPTTLAELATIIQTAVDGEFGANIVDVNDTATGIEFSKDAAADIGYFSFSTSSSEESVDALDVLKIDSGDRASGHLQFTINSKEFTIEAYQSINSMINSINGDDTANVNMYYDEVTDKFRFVAKQLGEGDNISISSTQEGNFFGTVSNIDNTGSYITTQGVDAMVEIDGQDLTRSSNTITVNGVTYTLLKADTRDGGSSYDHEIVLTMNTDNVYDNISNFVEAYNELIDTINEKTDEEYDRDYLPLTDEQKEEMTEDEIELWEEKAKTGLLRNDSLLDGFLQKMRYYLWENVGDMATNLSSIGITSGSYEDNGKLEIDETELKEAIENDPDGVMNLFSKQSSSYSSFSRTMSSSEREIRFNEEGLSYRLHDIIEDYISTSRDNNGYKGFMLEKAGMEGDVSQYSNVLFDEIKDYETRMDTLLDRLADKEDLYYSKFTQMERLIANMNTQSNWLSQQFSQTSNQ